MLPELLSGHQEETDDGLRDVDVLNGRGKVDHRKYYLFELRSSSELRNLWMYNGS